MRGRGAKGREALGSVGREGVEAVGDVGPDMVLGERGGDGAYDKHAKRWVQATRNPPKLG